MSRQVSCGSAGEYQALTALISASLIYYNVEFFPNVCWSFVWEGEGIMSSDIRIFVQQMATHLISLLFIICVAKHFMSSFTIGRIVYVLCPFLKLLFLLS